MYGLGRVFDVGLGWSPVDIDTANGATGKRVSLANASGITFLVQVSVAASGSDDLVLDVQQATAYTGGTSGDLDVVTQYYYKTEVALDNDETWVKVTQAAASEVTFAGATFATDQQIIAIYVGADQLSDGYGWVSLNAAITTSAVRLSSCLYLLHDLKVQRKPENLGNLLNPGAANA